LSLFVYVFVTQDDVVSTHNDANNVARRVRKAISGANSEARR